MQLIKGNLWKSEAYLEGNFEVLCFSANAFISPSSKLVMGRGFAQQVRDYFPGVDRLLGQQIMAKMGSQPGQIANPYYCCSVPWQINGRKVYIAALQVKHFFREKGDWALTEQSLRRLAQVSQEKGLRVLANMPLIGNAGYGQQFEQVLALLEQTCQDAPITFFYR